MSELTDAESASRLRAGSRCQLCRATRRAGAQLCHEHCDQLARLLNPDYPGERDLERAASIPVLYARLDPAPTTTGPAERRAPGYASEPPANLHVIAMRDPRSVAYPVVDVWYEPLHPETSSSAPDLANPHHEDTTAPRAVTKAIAGLADAVWDDLGYHGPRPPPRRTVEQHCRWLHAHLHHLTARDDAADIHRDLTDLHDQLRPAAGDPEPRPIAACTGWVRNPHTHEKIECGHPLYLPPPQPGVTIDPATPVLRCARCDRPYTHLMLLRQQISAGRKAG